MSTAAPCRTQSLDEWLHWLETIHPVAIDMGLERVSAVADRVGLRPAKAPLILVGGTNGKGSTVAMLSAIYQTAGYNVGAYTSPHITHFCERICINGQMVEESAVVEALAFIEEHRAPQTLTYFEYTTLAAMRVFEARQCEVLLFEVGLGGRLDATNIWDADCSIITSIALDHQDYLGSDVSVIATEKAAIGRPGKPFVTGEMNPPPSLARYADKNAFRHIDVAALPADELPDTTVPGDYQRRNAGCARAAVQALQGQLPVAQPVVSEALLTASLQGRFERMSVDNVPVVLDVAHNPAGAAALAQAWVAQFGEKRCNIIFASLADKDIAGVVNALLPIADKWYCIALESDRAMSVDDLTTLVENDVDADRVNGYHLVDDALAAAVSDAGRNDKIVLVAGSFYTIAEARVCLQRES